MRAALGVLAALAASVDAKDGVRQIHLALTQDEASMSVQWVANATSAAAPPTVRYGLAADALTMIAHGDAKVFTVDAGRTWYTHVAVMRGLSPDTRYFYAVADAAGTSDVRHFVNARKRAAGDPYKHIIVGDLGAAFAFSVCTACSGKSLVCDKATCAGNTSVGLVSETDADMLLHVGDFAYNLNTDGGAVGDRFFENMEQVSAYLPYMVSVGNHENDAGALAHFAERYRAMPVNSVPPSFNTTNGATPNNLYFSWDKNLVHYISISTEVWFLSYTGVTKAGMLQWLEEDLKAATAPAQRALVPWIVVEGHRSMYCTSNDGDCSKETWELRNDLEELLYRYGVDLFVNGHEHDYERTYPLAFGYHEAGYVNPNATVYVVNGGAGNQEIHDPFTKDPPSWSAFRANTFSYSRVLIHNATHLQWQQVQTDPYDGFPMSEYGEVIDDWWVVQHRHAPFKPEHAPKLKTAKRCSESAATKCTSYDHWEPLLGLDDGSGRSLVERIRAYRAAHGDAAWRAKLDGLLSSVHGRMWEDVRDNGYSDNAWAKDKPREEVPMSKRGGVRPSRTGFQWINSDQ
eukprot:TRINITY_DN15998_c0_g1_i1.p1 TRINITY_DN15998_c0_g1~~TRINITY_DN15998_c0_g1_i1.p1  ORF type:complete len:573 (+),score=191.29 TRINITY_DN15998_c0_g1_i1:72-1790(+)